jgi:hypothetical protein
MPLPTPRRRPHERQRMTRGHRGSLALAVSGSHIPCPVPVYPDAPRTHVRIAPSAQACVIRRAPRVRPLARRARVGTRAAKRSWSRRELRAARDGFCVRAGQRRSASAATSRLKCMKAESRRSNGALDVVRVSDRGCQPEPLVTRTSGRQRQQAAAGRGCPISSARPDHGSDGVPVGASTYRRSKAVVARPLCAPRGGRAHPSGLPDGARLQVPGRAATLICARSNRPRAQLTPQGRWLLSGALCSCAVCRSILSTVRRALSTGRRTPGARHDDP